MPIDQEYHEKTKTLCEAAFSDPNWGTVEVTLFVSKCFEALPLYVAEVERLQKELNAERDNSAEIQEQLLKAACDLKVAGVEVERLRAQRDRAMELLNRFAEFGYDSNPAASAYLPWKQTADLLREWREERGDG